MRGKFNILFIGIILGVLLMTLIYHFADDILKFIGSGDHLIKWILLATTAMNTCLIVYILRLTKNDNDRS